MGKLNDKAVFEAQPRVKLYGIADGEGLTLVVKPNGTKLWWLRYRFSGKAKTLSLGVYPVVSLKQAREWALDARKLLAAGFDPSAVKQEAKKPVEAVEIEKRGQPVTYCQPPEKQYSEKQLQKIKLAYHRLGKLLGLD